ncbi:MAG TPA: malto-oligosyltrehalose trehalohydrolase [Chthoniobacterales bacterium]|nr:malto-oligosyltrehalose trehalohydrolase [Chthoniobacterales bacterium]
MTHQLVPRRYPIGAEVIAPGRTHFRVWAPKARRIDLVLEQDVEAQTERRFQPLIAEANGYFSVAAEVGAGALYRFRLNDNEHFHPDPASRYQPGGPHRSSLVVDHRDFRWSDQPWPGLNVKGQIIYEMHVGTFTHEGTWRAAARQLRALARTGISVIEMMPIADFAGEFGWGYDGVNLFAPYHRYGPPDDLRRFVDRAHSLGMGVILDVVYNHFGPDGNYLPVFSDDYFTHRYKTDWGTPPNFDGPNSGPVREFFLTNARYWIEEFHFDGFRFDATQSIFDQSGEHILAALGKAARAAAGARSVFLVAENEPQETRLVRPRAEGGYGLDSLWNDDLHHTALVALTGRHEAYYTDYRGTPQEFVSTVKHGFLYQGQRYFWQKKRRGTSTRGLGPEAFVGFIENHDQVANSGTGERVRLTTSPGRYRALLALILLGPWTPMLLQGQEFGATTPFLYFADVSEELRTPVRKGRLKFLRQFPSLASSRIQSRLADPSDAATFQRSKLDFSERSKFPEIGALCRDLIRLRRQDKNFSRQERDAVDGAVLGPRCFVLRYFDSLGDDRLLVVNLGPVLALEVAPEPLLASPRPGRWKTLWSSEAMRYGGAGKVALEGRTGWVIPAEAAVVLRPVLLRDPS